MATSTSSFLRDLGEAASSILHLHMSFYRRQPDGGIRTAPFNPDARGNVDDPHVALARWGRHPSDVKGPGFGENLVIDWIPTLYPKLNLPPNYRLTHQDISDLRYVRGLYPSLQDMYRTLTGEEPGVGNSGKEEPEPGPVPDPSPKPQPEPVPDTATAELTQLRAQVASLQSLLTSLIPGPQTLTTLALMKDWNDKTVLGAGRRGRIRGLIRYVEGIKTKIEEASQ